MLFFQFLCVFCVRLRAFACVYVCMLVLRVCGSQRTDNKSISCVNIKLPAADNAHSAMEREEESESKRKRATL